jgi:membrane protein
MRHGGVSLPNQRDSTPAAPPTGAGLPERSVPVSSHSSGGAATEAKQRLDKLDTYQQQHKPVAIPIAVFKKFTEDQSTNLASMIAFWAFFSIFPLLLVLVTLLGFLPAGTKNSVLHQVSSYLPLLNTSSIGGLTGSWWALIVGIVTALWSGSAVVRTVQAAFNSVWEIPMHERPKFVEKLLRSIFVLSTIGVGLVISVLITGFVSGTSNSLNLHWFGHLFGYVIAIALDVGLFVAAFRMLTDRDISTRDVLPGAVLSGVVFWILQSLSSLIISHYLSNAQSTYGTFATVITMLWWFYITSIVTLLGAQLNVVLKERLYPRGLVNPPDTEADHRLYDNFAKERTYHEDEQVQTSFADHKQS